MRCIQHGLLSNFKIKFTGCLYCFNRHGVFYLVVFLKAVGRRCHTEFNPVGKILLAVKVSPEKKNNKRSTALGRHGRR